MRSLKKKYFALPVLLLLMANGLHSQSWIYFTGTVRDKDSWYPVTEYPVFTSTDDSLGGLVTFTNYQGVYFDSLFLMPGQYAAVTVLDCQEEPHTQEFPNPDSLNTADFSICVFENDCFAFFSWEPDSADLQTIQFFNFSEGNFTTWEWDFGDGTTSTEFDPVHHYENAGVYQVCLSISDSSGSCQDTYCDYVVAGEGGCVADFNWEPDVDNPMKINFTDLSSGNMDYWNWDFGDGKESLEQNPSHIYEFPGTYTVTLNIFDSLGFCYDFIEKEIYVINEPNCEAGFAVTLDTLNNTPYVYLFQDQSDGNPDTWYWDFGDGNFSYEQNPVHTYEKGGTYEVCLSITADSCFDTKCLPVTTPSYFDFGGQVFLGNYPINIEDDDSANRAIAYLYRRFGNKWELMDTREFWKFGYYWFTQKTEGEYIIRTDLLAGSPDYDSYAPAYHENKSFWTGATIFDLKDNEQFTVNIHLKETVAMAGGISEIYGTLKTGASCDDELDMEHQLVYLLNSENQVVAYTYSDADGKFNFQGLGKGSYRVRAEITGKLSPVADVEIDDSNLMPGEIILEIDCNAWVGVDEEFADAENGIFISNLFPQPASENITVELSLKNAGNFQFEFIDLTGKTVWSQTARLSEGKNRLTMDARRFKAGLYLLKVSNLTNPAVITKKILIR
ncbi:MAG TPA: PKD domain-containing protein [Bacteroidetes bacterium]|nr:PKD domain-containing protein [Bacteroidota bacterium]